MLTNTYLHAPVWFPCIFLLCLAQIDEDESQLWCVFKYNQYMKEHNEGTSFAAFLCSEYSRFISSPALKIEKNERWKMKVHSDAVSILLLMLWCAHNPLHVFLYLAQRLQNLIFPFFVVTKWLELGRLQKHTYCSALAQSASVLIVFFRMQRPEWGLNLCPDARPCLNSERHRGAVLQIYLCQQRRRCEAEQLPAWTPQWVLSSHPAKPHRLFYRSHDLKEKKTPLL